MFSAKLFQLRCLAPPCCSNLHSLSQTLATIMSLGAWITSSIGDLKHKLRAWTSLDSMNHFNWNASCHLDSSAHSNCQASWGNHLAASAKPIRTSWRVKFFWAGPYAVEMSCPPNPSKPTIYQWNQHPWCACRITFDLCVCVCIHLGGIRLNVCLSAAVMTFCQHYCSQEQSLRKIASHPHLICLWPGNQPMKDW